MLLDDRVAIVTGAGRGIGREFALELARQGAAVVVNDLGVGLRGEDSDEDPATAVCAEIEAFGGRAVPSHESVTDFEATGRTVQTALDTFGRLDILVNNAGIVRDRTLVKMTEDDFDAVIATHLKGAFNCARHAVPVMKEAGYGRIINVTSSAGLRGNFGQTNYGAAKAGIMGMTFVWALELAKAGITVNAIAPAGATRMTAALAGDDAEPDPRLDPAMNAPLVAFLASEAGRPRQRTALRAHGLQLHRCSSTRSRSPGCTATAAGTPSRWPPTSTSCWASTSRAWAWSCPRV